jgi:hypothetical protein
MKTKKDYKHAQFVVRKVIGAWDPYALLEGGAPDDEFAPEIDEIVRQLPKIKSEDEAIQAISMVMSSAFEKEKFTPEKCTAVGKELFARCKEEGLIG